MGCNENCGQSCEAVADLQEYAANLIEYSKRIDKWVNGGQNDFVDVGGVSTPTLRNLAMMIKALMGVHPDNKTIFINQDKEIYARLDSLIQTGSGLVIGNDGKLYIDFNQMPTDKFEELLKSLRLPIWLENNTFFYVNKNHAAASDELDDGRGLSPAKPFKTIQACADFVADNYNVGPFNVYILVSGGTYTEKLTLTGYSRGSGYIVIHPASASDTVILDSRFDTLSREPAINCEGGVWVIDSLDIHDTLILDNNTLPTTRYRHGIVVNLGARLRMQGFDITYDSSLPLTQATPSLQQWIFNCAQGELELQSHGVIKNRASRVIVAAGSLSNAKKVFVIGGEDTVRAYGVNDDESLSTCSVSGDFTAFCAMSGGMYVMLPYLYPMTYPVIAGGSVSGKRYELSGGGRVNTVGRGENYFPGTEPGTLDASTFCWYR